MEVDVGITTAGSLFRFLFTPIVVGIALWIIINKLKVIRGNQVRKDNSDRLLEIKVDAIAYAMSKQPPPIGAHFTEHYEKKINERMTEEKFLDHNKTTT